MKIKLLTNRILIVFDVLLRHVINRRNTCKKTVAIVFQQIFGDSIVIADSLKCYTEIFSKEKGYEIICLVRPSVMAFMKDTLVLPKGIRFETLDFKKYLENFLYYKSVNEKYKNKIDTLVVPGTSLSAEIFSVASNAKRKVGLVRSIDVDYPFLTALFSKIAYTEKVRPDKEDMMLQRHRLLLNYLGAKNYKAKLPVLQPKKKIISEDCYCVLCAGSSKMEKCWPTERFSEIIDYVIEQYDMNVHLCGGIDESEFEKIILSQVKNSERVVSHVGKTSFSDWSAIVQHADLVIGNDSATMHLAAASRRKAICIAGVYDKYQFFPYKVDVLEEGDVLPLTLYKDMPCEWCRTVGYDAGFGNEDCKKRIEDNKCALCIDAITVTEVENTIRQLLSLK